MARVKRTFIALLLATSAFIALTMLCFFKTVVYAPKPPQPEVVNGVVIDPTWEQIEAYNKALRDLKPYSLFLEYAWIGFLVLMVLWLTPYLIQRRFWKCL